MKKEIDCHALIVQVARGDHMGVPKFYRWISERYPCLSEVISDTEIPEFDNLYLDMNGIIHNCSHPNDDDVKFRISQEQIFADIFAYIDKLFNIIRPKKVFFLAVDGVAPRAKMNQQRARRFMSARTAEEQLQAHLRKGEELPKEKRFDSNCITPGTLFMAELHSELSKWLETKCPGEGEHKIMDFIRHERTLEGYDSNTRHCMYGLDADLLMLGICSHEPHFSLLREEVKFNRPAPKKSGAAVPHRANPSQINFHLLHLSLLREYLYWEFYPLKVFFLRAQSVLICFIFLQELNGYLFAGFTTISI
ncbi:XRN 5'-3' exonuclease [Ancylostoma duodenale]|uniref:XRN 5'-3' exonuclease n=1 Tax=Ancylostoma duodenale TaxID=51022 RepID=A0A0C2G9U9_9BILA|nr:XRN 5'-3' exonuclease [Ancylostoma duodenale]